MHDQILLQFLQGRGPDSQGRYHGDILNFSDEELENTHDYIQWLFPLDEKSGAVPGSPFLENKEIIQSLKNDEDVQKAMKKALARMSSFYRDNDFWLRQGDHNHLRITRILKSLSLLGNIESAQGFYDFIRRRVENAMPVTNETFEYWKESISGVDN